ncbi:MAG: alpha/beta fold hydrolase [Prevotella sp.]|nr:alpha/beta fold hydrolase [Prevotella sp.]
MKRLILFCALLCSTVLTTSAQRISGTWHGAMRLNSIELNLVLHLDGDSTCTVDSPDQGARGIAGTVKEITAEKVDVAFPMLMAAYTAELKDGKLVGTFKQRGFSVPLTLEPGDLVRQRPQTPQPPFPYETREVTFSHDSITLAGTLTLPARTNGKNVSPSPFGEGRGGASLPLRGGDGGGLCLLLVTGSGLQDRDETIFDHKPFAVIADYLARHGIATLRYDDRGFGQSTGDPTQCTTADFAEDAAAGIAFLRSLKATPQPIQKKKGQRSKKASPTGGGLEGALFSKVGILGHSEGGSIAFMLGSKQLVDCIVALAAPGIKGDTLLVEQTNALLRLSGQPANLTLRTMRIMMAAQETTPWYNYFMEYDPSADIAATRCPVLALNGSLDSQVLPDSNLGAIRQLSNLRPWNGSLPMGEGGGRGFSKLYPGLNHLFQHAQTGAATEYGNIEETISEEVLSDIATWLKRLF